MRDRLFNMTERDFDLMLLEELHADTGFASWLAQQIGISDATFESARHSVSAKANAKWGETDVLAVFKKGNETIAVLIEDKIAAAFADRQAERYQERAKKLREPDGGVQRSVILLCAPQSYLDAVPKDDPWDRTLSLETIRDWFADCGTVHGNWRAKALGEKLKSLKATGSAGSDDVSRFSKAFGAYLRSLDEDLNHNETGDKYGFIFDMDETEGSIELAWKNNQGLVDLSFWGDHRGKAAYVPAPPGISLSLAPGRAEKTDIYSIEVPVADVTQPFDSQLEIVAEVMDAARRLLPLIRQVIDSSPGN